jgi:uncharacterized protein
MQQSMNRSQILILLGVTAVILMTIAQVWRQFTAVGLFPFSWNVIHIGYGIALAIAISVMSTGVYRWWPQYRASADYYLDLILRPLALPDLIWVGLLPGMSEEMLFRGVMLPEVGADWIGVILSSLCFGALHMTSTKHWAYVVWASAIGMVFAWSAILTQNLLVPIVAHVLTNLISAIVWKINPENH